MPKREELLTIRIEPKLKEKLKMLEREKMKTGSGIIREALEKFIRREEELKEIKADVAKKFVSGKLSFEELVRILGYEEASKIVFFVEKAKKAFKGFR